MIVCYIIAEYTVLLEGTNVLTTAMSYLPYKMTPFTSKAGDVQNEVLPRKKQSLETANEHGNDEDEQNHVGTIPNKLRKRKCVI